jgi:hypothetical protein
MQPSRDGRKQKRRATGAGELSQFAKHSHSLRREWNNMLVLHLHALGRDTPQRFTAIEVLNFRPLCRP